MRNVVYNRYALAVLVMTMAASLGAGQETSWAGKPILIKKAGVRFGHTGDNGEQVYLGTLDQISYTVLQDQDRWLQIRQNGVEGWFPKNEAVLLEDAVDFFTTRIQNDAQDKAAFQYRAVAYSQRGELDLALKDLDEAIRLDPKSAAFWNSRGNVWMNKKDLDKAIKDYDEALRLNPDPANKLLLHANRGRIWHERKELDKALADYNEAVKINPKYAQAYNNRGNIWLDRKAYDKALEDYEAAIKADSKLSLAFNNRAWLLCTCPDPKYRNGVKALESAKKACELSGFKDPADLDTLAAAHAENGQFEEAVKWQQKALDDPGYVKIHGDVGRKRLQLYREKKPFRED